MGFNFPYGNKQQLNLDWFLRKFKELVAAWNDKEESIDGALDAEIQKAEDALSDVYTARDVAVAAKNDALTAKADALTAAANAAQYWQNAAASANSAATSAVTALQAAQDAADDADQTSRDRASVTADKAAVAADKATVAADKAAVAADKAAVAQDKADTDDIKNAANAAALRSEGWADGMQNGTPVTSGSPYYQNNAKYFKEQAKDILDSIPADYTALSDDVDELKDDVAELQQQSGRLVNTIENVVVASFDDGLDAPVQKLVINIESSQTGCEINKTGSNQFDKSAAVIGEGLNTSGGTISSQTSSRSDYIKVVPNTQYRKIFDVSDGIGRLVQCFDAEKNFINYLLYNNASADTVFTTPANCFFVRIAFPTSQIDNVRLIFATSGQSTEFEPYNGATVSISWATEVGTITSGTLEIDANGSVTLVTGGETYQLQSIAQINTLAGNNNIWSNTGNINLLKYIANSKNYIDEHDALIKAIIAKELQTMTADTALTANDFRIVNNTLYRITANIAAGATLTPNTNCIATTVADILKTLL